MTAGGVMRIHKTSQDSQRVKTALAQVVIITTERVGTRATDAVKGAQALRS